MLRTRTARLRPLLAKRAGGETQRNQPRCAGVTSRGLGTAGALKRAVPAEGTPILKESQSAILVHAIRFQAVFAAESPWRSFCSSGPPSFLPSADSPRSPPQTEAGQALFRAVNKTD